MMKTRTLIAVFLLGLAGSVLAEDVPATDGGSAKEWCKANREECKKRLQEKCAADPKACEEKKAARREKMREKCQADPAACEKMREKRAADTDSTTP